MCSGCQTSRHHYLAEGMETRWTTLTRKSPVSPLLPAAVLMCHPGSRSAVTPPRGPPRQTASLNGAQWCVCSVVCSAVLSPLLGTGQSAMYAKKKNQRRLPSHTHTLSHSQPDTQISKASHSNFCISFSHRGTLETKMHHYTSTGCDRAFSPPM